MLSKEIFIYSEFIKNVLTKKCHYSLKSSKEIVSRFNKVSNGLYISSCSIDEEKYNVLFRLTPECIDVDTKLHRSYLSSDGVEWVNEEHSDTTYNRFTKGQSGIHYRGAHTSKTTITKQFGATREVTKTDTSEAIYQSNSNDTINDVDFSKKPIMKTLKRV